MGFQKAFCPNYLISKSISPSNTSWRLSSFSFNQFQLSKPKMSTPVKSTLTVYPNEGEMLNGNGNGGDGLS